jgi:DNA mismatch repair ATPase MutS
LNHTSELCFASLIELLMQLVTVHICRLLAQCLQQTLTNRSATVLRCDVIQVILQDAEMCWMLRDKHVHRIPDLQAIAKKLGQSRLAYKTAIGVVEIMWHIYIYC